jgi:DNA-3-methyladenine glycosylase II
MGVRLDPETCEAARRELARRDPVLRPVIERVGRCALRPRGDPYRFLVRAILRQQIAGAAARAIEARLLAGFDGRLPPPAVLAAARSERLRRAGLSRQKAVAIRAVARAFRDGAVPRRLAALDDDAVIAAVTGIHGVGLWTAHMLLMFSLGRPDVLPLGDFGVRKAAQLLYGLRELPRGAELGALAERWRPWRSVASWYLWRALDAPAPA